MRKVALGRTGLEISELALGGGVTGGLLLDRDEEKISNALNAAFAAGINWIDTAPVYGDGESERAIARHRDALSPPPNLSTKVRLEVEDLGDLRGAIERSLEQSLTRLRASSIALFQLHNHLGRGVGKRLALTPAQVLGRGGVADTFDRLREQGLFAARGLTVAGDTAACLDVIASGRFDVAQVYYNVINPSAAWQHLPSGWNGGQGFCGVLEACRRQNMGVLNIRVWAGGVLAASRPPQQLLVITSDTDFNNEVRCAAAVRSALGEDEEPAQAALRFALGNRDFASHVIGVSSIQQLEAALAALARGPLPAETMSRLAALWANGLRTED